MRYVVEHYSATWQVGAGVGAGLGVPPAMHPRRGAAVGRQALVLGSPFAALALRVYLRIS